MIKAIETCIAGKNGMIGCKNAEPSNSGDRNGKVIVAVPLDVKLHI